MDPVDLVVPAVLFGIGANICFCLGPYTEFIITALGFPLSARRIRYFLFGAGLMISLGGIMLVWFMLELSSGFPASLRRIHGEAVKLTGVPLRFSKRRVSL